jgi:glutathione S-transferase
MREDLAVASWLEVEQAIDLPGMRLVLSRGFAGPWGEAAKGILHVKRIPFTRVAQYSGMPNETLGRWTGQTGAPVAVYGKERPRSGWAEILLQAERLAPEPRLVPRDPAERALLFGLSHEICGEDGFGWNRRLMMLDQEDAPEAVGGLPLGEMTARLKQKYGYDADSAQRAPARVAQIVRMLAARLRAQREAGSLYLVGSALSAADIYWAAFAAMLEPLPPELCPVPEYSRQIYSVTDPLVRDAMDPILIEHRDRIYRDHLELPVDL